MDGLKQIILPEDAADVVVALNEDIRTAYKELVVLKDQQDQRRSELDTFKATEVDYGPVADMTYSERAEQQDWIKRRNELQGHVRTATNKVNNQKDRIVRQVCETIEAIEGVRGTAPV